MFARGTMSQGIDGSRGDVLLVVGSPCSVDQICKDILFYNGSSNWPSEGGWKSAHLGVEIQAPTVEWEVERIVRKASWKVVRLLVWMLVLKSADQVVDLPPHPTGKRWAGIQPSCLPSESGGGSRLLERDEG